MIKIQERRMGEMMPLIKLSYPDLLPNPCPPSSFSLSYRIPIPDLICDRSPIETNTQTTTQQQAIPNPDVGYYSISLVETKRRKHSKSISLLRLLPCHRAKTSRSHNSATSPHICAAIISRIPRLPWSVVILLPNPGIAFSGGPPGNKGRRSC